MAQERTLLVKIAGDSSSLDKAFKKSAQSGREYEKQIDLTKKAHDGFSKSAVFAATSLLGGAGLVSALHSSVDAAIRAEESQKRLEAQLGSLGIAYKDHARQIDTVIQKQSQLSAFDDEDLQASFTNLVRVTKDVSKALDLNGVAADVARGKNVSLEAATAIVTKASLGQLGALKRMGVEIAPVTTAVDALKDAHGKASSAQLAAAKAADATATRQQALAILQKQFAGASEAYGKTAAGAQERLKVATENLQESIGTALLPAVSKISNALSGWIGKSENQEKVQNAVNQVTKIAGQVIDTVWPKIKTAAHWADELAQKVGGWDKAFAIVLSGVLANKVLGLAGSFGGTNGLAGNLFRATSGITGKGGLIGALGLIPSVIGVAVVISAMVPASVKALGQDTLDAAGIGFMGKLPLVGSVVQAATGGGRKLGEKIGIKTIDTGGYTSGTKEHTAYMEGLQGKKPPEGTLTNGPVLDAYLAGRKKGSPIKSVPVTTVSGSQAFETMAAVDYSGGAAVAGAGAAASAGGSGGGGGGGSKPSQVQVEKVAKAVVDVRDRVNKAIAARNTRAFENYSNFGMGASNQAGPMSGFNADSIAGDKARAATANAAAAAAVQDRLAKMKQAVDAGRAAFATAFGQLGEAASKAIEQKYAKMQAALAASLKSQLSEIEKARVQLTPAEQALADMQREHDRAARDRALTDALATGDARQIADAQYAIKIAALQDQAAAERKARDEEARAATDAAQTAYDAQTLAYANQLAADQAAYASKLDALNTYLTNRAASVTNANDIIQGEMGELAAALDQQINAVVTRLGNVQAAMGSAPNAAAALAVAFPNFHAMASGGDFNVTSPTLFLAGEAGPERATFSPAGGKNYHGGGTSISVYVSGSVVTERELTESIRRGLIKSGISGASTSVVARSRTGV